MRRAALTLLALATALAGCATTSRSRPSAIVAAEQPAWTGLISPADGERLAALPALFAKARADVPRSRMRLVTAEGGLLDPEAVQTLPELPPGPYHCRLIRFGGRARFATFKPDFCYVDAGKGGRTFAKQTGSNLPQGWIYPDGDNRQVFLGALRRKGDPERRYGDSDAYNLAGIVERVSPFRWRLILTKAGGDATLDVYELVPVTPGVPGAPNAVPAS